MPVPAPPRLGGGGGGSSSDAVVSRLQVRGGGGASTSGSSSSSGFHLPDVPQLPHIELPQLPSPPQLPRLPNVTAAAPQLPSELPDASALAAALRDAAANAAASAAQLPAAAEAQLAALQALLLAPPGGGARDLGLEPHFGTNAAAAALRELAAALSGALGAPRALPPMLQLPTGAGDARLADLLPPGALASAWASASDALAALLPPGAAASLAAGAAAVSAEQAAAAASLAEAADKLRAAAAALPETGHAGVDFASLCFVAAAVLAASAASVPPATHEATLAPRDEAPLGFEYDADAAAAYFSRRPLAVAARSLELAREAAALGLALLGDVATGRLEANAGARARQLRGAIERLGPAYVKVAQALSTRVDLLSPDYFEQIQLLQDRVPPFACADARAAMADAFGRPVGDVLEWVSPRPVAAASLGQVYRARLAAPYGGGDVAVKVLRPGVLEQVSLDLYLMRRVATAVSAMPDVRTDWPALIDNWAARFLHEMDYAREADNALRWQAQMAAAGVAGVTIARPVDGLCGRGVLVTEWVEGEKLSESGAADVRALCTTLLNAYLVQLLDTGLLHAGAAFSPRESARVRLSGGTRGADLIAVFAEHRQPLLPQATYRRSPSLTTIPQPTKHKTQTRTPATSSARPTAGSASSTSAS